MRLTKIHAANLVALVLVARASGVSWFWALSCLWGPLLLAGLLILGIALWSALVILVIQE